MKNLEIRPLHRTDRDGMVELLATRDSATRATAEQRWTLLEWMAFHNPSARDRPTYYVAVYKGKTVAHLGRMPADFSYKGNDLQGYFIHDLFVHPETRKMGLGFFISMGLYDRANADSDSFCCLVWTTPLNLELQRKSGYTETYAAGLVRPLNANDFTKNSFARLILNPPAAIASRTAAFFLGGFTGNGITTSVIPRCDERFNHLWARVRSRLTICSAKTAAVLNWKYVDRPMARETIITAEKEGALAGFVVLTTSPEKREDKVGIIVDLLADPDDTKTIDALCHASLGHFHSLGLGSARAVMSDPRFSSVFRRNLFLSTKNSRRVVMFGNLEHSQIPPEVLTDTTQWTLTRGESDGYMLST